MIEGDPEFVEAIVNAEGVEICTHCDNMTCVQDGDTLLKGNKGWEVVDWVRGSIKDCKEGYLPEYK